VRREADSESLNTRCLSQFLVELGIFQYTSIDSEDGGLRWSSNRDQKNFVLIVCSVDFASCAVAGRREARPRLTA